MEAPQQPGDAAAPSSTVQEMLLAEARAEIGRLRTENFQCKRLAEERLGALQRLTGERDQLMAQYHQHQSLLAACQAQIQQLQGVEVQLAELQQAHQTLQQEHELSLRARRILQEELVDERKQRKQVEESKAALESERSRHQRSKDDLALSLRVARKKAEEAEEEQLRAEQEAAQLQDELRALQSGVGGGGGGGEKDGGEVGDHAGNDSNYFLHPHKTSLPGAAQVAVEEALRAAEYERCRAEALLSRLAAAEEEVASLGQELQAMEGMRTELFRAQHALRNLQADQHKVQQQDSSQPPSTSQPPPMQSQPQPPSPPLPHSQPEQQAQQGPTYAQAPPPDQFAPTGEGLQPFADHVLPPDVLAELEALRSKVAKLKASRDKLLEQIDKQWEELDRVGLESKAANDELASTRRLAANWEAQAQDSLAHVDRLKEMLEEASTWGNGPANSSQSDGNPLTEGKPQGDGSAAGAYSVPESAFLQEKARSAEMELTARACAAELLRAQHASMSMGKAMLPALSGIEYRLMGMLRAQQVNQQ